MLSDVYKRIFLIFGVLTPLSAVFQLARVAQWVRSLDLTAHTNLSPIRHGFPPSFVNYKKGALDSQSQVIKFTSCLPRIRGSHRVLRGSHRVLRLPLVWAVRSNDLTHWATRAPSHFLLCYNTIVINHAHIVYAPCGPLIGESINIWLM
jgi:hypothetical protein